MRIAVPTAPAVNEVRYWIVNTERCSVQVSADLHVISRHQTNGGLVFFVKHLSLQRRTQQQHEIIYIRETEEREDKFRVDMEDNEADGIFACLLTADTLFYLFIFLTFISLVLSVRDCKHFDLLRSVIAVLSK